MSEQAIYLGHIVKSNSHCDYVAQLVDRLDVPHPPAPEDYGFGRFVKLEDEQRHWAVGVIYNSQLLNPQFHQISPRLTTNADTFLSPDLVSETRTLLWIALIGHLVTAEDRLYGQQGMPTLVVPVNTPVWQLTTAEVLAFHRSAQGQAQFRYYAHLLRSTGNYAAPLLAQILETITPLFSGTEQRSLEIINKELAWRHTLGTLR
ncbi:hypothetical protein RHJ63_13040 [Thermosynechococcus sp. JY1334]|uniref:hypothetical protein n=1 Tax=unclassified Thermosynechococcus TaxID=2622553 RepID=UPI002671949C|nr:MULTISPECIES: hypothetical protein [unclassified Thermosynechococcus]MDR7899231.1 hypothetical protein [Thermosynechococcus sp. JY1332]MDR7906635.1 hypothetical protein [Thermosynechococcus sp. JY1334]MDR7994461.1 hypothetical protein [Thermosynechococcus sp. TG252]WKT86353.1 hypothetical protein QYC30_13075 [Thermosynechococcus sp. JY1339]WNC55297.1 hypothetical protein RHJ31_13060 [Thermosynechococcus sp. JY1331]